MKRVLVVAAILLTAACGSSSTSSGQSNSSNSSSSSASGFQLVTKTSLNGTALSDPQGMTLYMFKSDSAGKPTCTGGCASTWPAETAPQALPTVTGLNGTWAAVTAADGSAQLSYDGWPLYRYSGDKSPSDANGQGIGGVWFAVTSTTTPNPGASSAGATTPAGSSSSSSSYNYYN